MKNYYTLNELSNNFRNTIYSLNIAAQKHFGDYLLNSEYDRIIYSTTQQALRKRANKKEWNNLLLPFLNFKVQDIKNEVKRTWFNHIVNIEGVYIPELGRKLRVNPITVMYDSTLFLHTESDLYYAFMEAVWDDSNETILRPQLSIDGQIIDNIANLDIGELGLEFDRTYAEQDWLEKNKIRTIGLNFVFATFMIKDNTDIHIPEKVLFDFFAMNDIDSSSTVGYENNITLLIDHFNEENIEQD